MGLWPQGEKFYGREDYHELRTDITSFARQDQELLQDMDINEQYFLDLGTSGNYEDMLVCHNFLMNQKCFPLEDLK